MKLIVICCINFCFYLSRKVFDRALPAGIAYYKNKRPPPVPGESFDRSVSIRFPHIDQSLQI